MNRLKRISDMVYHCLTLYPDTRGNDRELVLRLYEDFYNVYEQPFYKIMLRPDLPSFESIRRSRQLLQAKYEELRAEKPVEDVRIAAQEDYIEFAKGEQI